MLVKTLSLISCELFHKNSLCFEFILEINLIFDELSHIDSKIIALINILRACLMCQIFQFNITFKILFLIFIEQSICIYHHLLILFMFNNFELHVLKILLDFQLQFNFVMFDENSLI